ncbi:dihydrofolate reductase [Candidatus Saccharibacteria bacterium]|nr:dihydrofolate reductase [Candidatus Saccharibacteria bacterium]
MFSLIAAIGKNRELGRGGELIFHLKDDMKFFRETTSGHKVVMGRKTWESLPGKLKNRTNIVISRHNIEGADDCVSDITDFIEKNKDTDEEIFIIGGGMVYFEFLKHAKNLYLTEVDASDDSADTFFPTFDKSKYSIEVIKKGSEDDLNYSIIKYTKN